MSNPFTVAGFIESFKIREAMRLKQPLPETELARLMQPMRLTNVNRDDDRISLLMRRYQDDYRADDIAIRVRNLLVHRLFSCEERIEAWGWPRTPEEIIDRAWMAEGTLKNSNINFGWKSAASAMRDCTCLVQLASKEVAPLLSALKVHSRKVHKLLESGWPMFGDFLAFQATLDLYWLFPERLEDDWAEFRISHPEINRTASATTFPFLARGSGTTLRLIRGLPIACVKPGNISPSCIGTKEMLPLGRQFRDEVAQAIGPQPLHVIEHWLCEYGKISLAQLGLGATRPRNPAPKNPGPAIRRAGA